MKSITFKYRFSFPNNDEKKFTIKLDPDTLLYKSQNTIHASWAKLTYNQCECCPLSYDNNPNCPIASNLSELVMTFKNTISYESCLVSCKTQERVVSKDTTVQDGLSSIMGIIMATSGCPIMEILKPMARFHLPFATIDEAMFRTVSVYLLRQYFTFLENGSGDFKLENIKSYYNKIEKVNHGILQRIKHATELDADNNAIITLNCLAQILHLELDDDLRSLQHIFKTMP